MRFKVATLAELPVEQSTKFEMFVNGKAAKALLFGSSNSQIATLVERHTRYVMLVKATSKDTEIVIDALIKNARK